MNDNHIMQSRGVSHFVRFLQLFTCDIGDCDCQRILAGTAFYIGFVPIGFKVILGQNPIINTDGNVDVTGGQVALYHVAINLHPGGIIANNGYIWVMYHTQ